MATRSERPAAARTCVCTADPAGRAGAWPSPGQGGLCPALCCGSGSSRAAHAAGGGDGDRACRPLAAPSSSPVPTAEPEALGCPWVKGCRPRANLSDSPRTPPAPGWRPEAPSSSGPGTAPHPAPRTLQLPARPAGSPTPGPWFSPASAGGGPVPDRASTLAWGGGGCPPRQTWARPAPPRFAGVGGAEPGPRASCSAGPRADQTRSVAHRRPLGRPPLRSPPAGGPVRRHAPGDTAPPPSAPREPRHGSGHAEARREQLRAPRAWNPGRRPVPRAASASAVEPRAAPATQAHWPPGRDVPGGSRALAGALMPIAGRRGSAPAVPGPAVRGVTSVRDAA